MQEIVDYPLPITYSGPLLAEKGLGSDTKLWWQDVLKPEIENLKTPVGNKQIRLKPEKLDYGLNFTTRLEDAVVSEASLYTEGLQTRTLTGEEKLCLLDWNRKSVALFKDALEELYPTIEKIELYDEFKNYRNKMIVLKNRQTQRYWLSVADAAINLLRIKNKNPDFVIKEGGLERFREVLFPLYSTPEELSATTKELTQSLDGEKIVHVLPDRTNPVYVNENSNGQEVTTTHSGPLIAESFFQSDGELYSFWLTSILPSLPEKISKGLAGLKVKAKRTRTNIPVENLVRDTIVSQMAKLIIESEKVNPDQAETPVKHEPPPESPAPRSNLDPADLTKAVAQLFPLPSDVSYAPLTSEEFHDISQQELAERQAEKFRVEIGKRRMQAARKQWDTIATDTVKRVSDTMQPEATNRTAPPATEKENLLNNWFRRSLATFIQSLEEAYPFEKYKSTEPPDSLNTYRTNLELSYARNLFIRLVDDIILKLTVHNKTGKGSGSPKFTSVLPEKKRREWADACENPYAKTKHPNYKSSPD